MVVKLIDVDAVDAIAVTVQALRRGELVVIPTDTIYGIAALAADPRAVERLFEAKERLDTKAIAVLVGSGTDALRLVVPEQRAALRTLTAPRWPGPLTVVARRRPGVGFALGGDAGTIGLRWPAHAFVTAVARAVGPLATTSANRAGEPTPPTIAPILDVFGDRVGVYVDGGELGGSASTVVDISSGSLQVLRQGPVVVGEH